MVYLGNDNNKKPVMRFHIAFGDIAANNKETTKNKKKNKQEK